MPVSQHPFVTLVNSRYVRRAALARSANIRDFKSPLVVATRLRLLSIIKSKTRDLVLKIWCQRAIDLLQSTRDPRSIVAIVDSLSFIPDAVNINAHSDNGTPRLPPLLTAILKASNTHTAMSALADAQIQMPSQPDTVPFPNSAADPSAHLASLTILSICRAYTRSSMLRLVNASPTQTPHHTQAQSPIPTALAPLSRLVMPSLTLSASTPATNQHTSPDIAPPMCPSVCAHIACTLARILLRTALWPQLGRSQPGAPPYPPCPGLGMGPHHTQMAHSPSHPKPSPDPILNAAAAAGASPAQAAMAWVVPLCNPSFHSPTHEDTDRTPKRSGPHTSPQPSLLPITSHTPTDTHASAHSCLPSPTAILPLVIAHLCVYTLCHTHTAQSQSTTHSTTPGPLRPKALTLHTWAAWAFAVVATPKLIEDTSDPDTASNSNTPMSPCLGQTTRHTMQLLARLPPASPTPTPQTTHGPASPSAPHSDHTQTRTTHGNSHTPPSLTKPLPPLDTTGAPFIKFLSEHSSPPSPFSVPHTIIYKAFSMSDAYPNDTPNTPHHVDTSASHYSILLPPPLWAVILLTSAVTSITSDIDLTFSLLDSNDHSPTYPESLHDSCLPTPPQSSELLSITHTASQLAHCARIIAAFALCPEILTRTSLNTQVVLSLSQLLPTDSTHTHPYPESSSVTLTMSRLHSLTTRALRILVHTVTPPISKVSTFLTQQLHSVSLSPPTSPSNVPSPATNSLYVPELYIHCGAVLTDVAQALTRALRGLSLSALSTSFSHPTDSPSIPSLPHLISMCIHAASLSLGLCLHSPPDAGEHAHTPTHQCLPSHSLPTPFSSHTHIGTASIIPCCAPTTLLLLGSLAHTFLLTHTLAPHTQCVLSHTPSHDYEDSSTQFPSSSPTARDSMWTNLRVLIDTTASLLRSINTDSETFSLNPSRDMQNITQHTQPIPQLRSPYWPFLCTAEGLACACIAAADATSIPPAPMQTRIRRWRQVASAVAAAWGASSEYDPIGPYPLTPPPGPIPPLVHPPTLPLSHLLPPSHASYSSPSPSLQPREAGALAGAALAFSLSMSHTLAHLFLLSALAAAREVTRSRDPPIHPDIILPLSPSVSQSGHTTPLGNDFGRASRWLLLRPRPNPETDFHPGWDLASWLAAILPVSQSVTRIQLLQSPPPHPTFTDSPIIQHSSPHSSPDAPGTSLFPFAVLFFPSLRTACIAVSKIASVPDLGLEVRFVPGPEAVVSLWAKRLDPFTHAPDPTNILSDYHPEALAPDPQTSTASTPAASSMHPPCPLTQPTATASSSCRPEWDQLLPGTAHSDDIPTHANIDDDSPGSQSCDCPPPWATAWATPHTLQPLRTAAAALRLLALILTLPRSFHFQQTPPPTQNSTVPQQTPRPIPHPSILAASTSPLLESIIHTALTPHAPHTNAVTHTAPTGLPSGPDVFPFLATAVQDTAPSPTSLHPTSCEHTHVPDTYTHASLNGHSTMAPTPLSDTSTTHHTTPTPSMSVYDVMPAASAVLPAIRLGTQLLRATLLLPHLLCLILSHSAPYATAHPSIPHTWQAPLSCTGTYPPPSSAPHSSALHKPLPTHVHRAAALVTLALSAPPARPPHITWTHLGPADPTPALPSLEALHDLTISSPAQLAQTPFPSLKHSDTGDHSTPQSREDKVPLAHATPLSLTRSAARTVQFPVQRHLSVSIRPLLPSSPDTQHDPAYCPATEGPTGQGSLLESPTVLSAPPAPTLLWPAALGLDVCAADIGGGLVPSSASPQATPPSPSDLALDPLLASLLGRPPGPHTPKAPVGVRLVLPIIPILVHTPQPTDTLSSQSSFHSPHHPSHMALNSAMFLDVFSFWKIPCITVPLSLSSHCSLPSSSVDQAHTEETSSKHDDTVILKELGSTLFNKTGLSSTTHSIDFIQTIKQSISGAISIVLSRIQQLETKVTIRTLPIPHDLLFRLQENEEIIKSVQSPSEPKDIHSPQVQIEDVISTPTTTTTTMTSAQGDHAILTTGENSKPSQQERSADDISFSDILKGKNKKIKKRLKKIRKINADVIRNSSISGFENDADYFSSIDGMVDEDGMIHF